MLSDARNLWKAMQLLNENISSALEGLDQSDDTEIATENSTEVVEKDELELYKKMLDDAQMQHFELSKQSRLLIAEKDAEVRLWKGKLAESTGETLDGVSITELDSLRLLTEKQALEENLAQTEEQLKIFLKDKNESMIKLQKFDEINLNYERLKEEFSIASKSWESRDRQKK